MSAWPPKADLAADIEAGPKSAIRRHRSDALMRESGVELATIAALGTSSPLTRKDSTTIIPTQVSAAAPAANCASTVTRALMDCDMKQRGSTSSMAWRAVASSASLATVT